VIETTRVDPVAATAIAFACAFIAGYLLNRRWTFRSSGAWTAELPRYLATQLVGLALNAAIMAIAVHGLALSPYAGLVLALLLVPPVSYALARGWAFAARSVDAQRPPSR
jgi:putative flippase GtrA